MEKQQRTNDGKSPDRKILSEVGENGVTIITINRPPLNLLSVDVLLSLKENVEEAMCEDNVKAIMPEWYFLPIHAILHSIPDKSGGVAGIAPVFINVKAIVITCSRGNVSAGFVVTAFGGSQQRKTHRELGFMSIDFITDTLEAARKPIVAAVEGFAVGGGFEIA